MISRRLHFLEKFAVAYPMVTNFFFCQIVICSSRLSFNKFSVLAWIFSFWQHCSTNLGTNHKLSNCTNEPNIKERNNDSKLALYFFRKYFQDNSYTPKYISVFQRIQTEKWIGFTCKINDDCLFILENLQFHAWFPSIIQSSTFTIIFQF